MALLGLALLLLTQPLLAQPDLGSDEELVRLSHRVVVAEVVGVKRGTHPQEPDRLQLRIVEDILGKGPNSLTVLFFGRVFERPSPKVGTRTLAFLRRSRQGWFPVRLDGLRPASQKERLVTLVAVRKTPEPFLSSSQDALLLQALEFLKPTRSHERKLRELLQHHNPKVQRKAASKLAVVDPRTAGDWLFAHWQVDDMDAFMEVHTAISSLLPKPLYVRVESTEQRRQAVELYRLAWWLASPLEREKALARLPGGREGFWPGTPGMGLRGGGALRAGGGLAGLAQRARESARGALRAGAHDIERVPGGARAGHHRVAGLGPRGSGCEICSSSGRCGAMNTPACRPSCRPRRGGPCFWWNTTRSSTKDSPS